MNRALKLGFVEFGFQARQACGEEDALAYRKPGLVARAVKIRRGKYSWRATPNTALEAWRLANILRHI